MVVKVIVLACSSLLKNEMTTHAQIESRREYFLQFNYVYTPDRYIGLWWQFRTRMMSEKEARAFITQVAPLGTMDYSLLHKRPPMIQIQIMDSLGQFLQQLS